MRRVSAWACCCSPSTGRDSPRRCPMPWRRARERPCWWMPRAAGCCPAVMAPASASASHWRHTHPMPGVRCPPAIRAWPPWTSTCSPFAATTCAPRALPQPGRDDPQRAGDPALAARHSGAAPQPLGAAQGEPGAAAGRRPGLPAVGDLRGVLGAQPPPPARAATAGAAVLPGGPPVRRRDAGPLRARPLRLPLPGWRGASGQDQPHRACVAGLSGRRGDRQAPLPRLRDPETRAAFDGAFQRVLGEGQEGGAECELLCRDGTRLPVAIQATAQVTEDGFQYSRATVFDLSERKALEARLEKQALTDPLTGLGNRRYLEGQAAMEIARAERSGTPLSLIAVDLDHFKRINDTYGHDVGDVVLQAFATLARQVLRDGDVLCRMGGEEFAVLLPDTTREQAMQVAERLRVAVATTPARVGRDATEDGTLAYTASLGVTLVSAGETTLKPAIKRADQGLYAAKETGRNRVRWEEA